jgi:phosphatidylglycerophosphatase A
VNGLLLWIAQGFGVGRIPYASGTLGSVIGLAWFALLVLPGNFWIYLAGTLAGLALSVPICGAGEKILQRKDPGSVVFDEIAAMPLCFAGWLVVVFAKTGTVLPPQYFFAKPAWPLTLAVFVAFRLFDIVKPWPVRGSQVLAGGWGVTVDDALAALYVNLVMLAYGGLTHFARWSQ